MTETINEQTEGATGSRCPRCDQVVDAGDRYCRDCGLTLPQDATAISAYMEVLLPKKIDEALAARLKDQKVVEIETSEQIAERAMKWMKLTGFFLGVPLLLFTTLISFLGFKTYADIEKFAQKISEAQPRLEASLQKAEALDKSLANTERQFASVQERISELDTKARSTETRQQNLEQDVKNLKARLSFSDSNALTPDLRDTLQNVLVHYIRYLEMVGFSHLDQTVEIVPYSKDEPPVLDPAAGPLQNYDYVNTMYANGRILIHRDILSDPTIAVRAYTDHALHKTLETERSDGSLSGEIHSALADYFTTSFFEDPVLGQKSAKSFGLSTPYVRTLDNNNQRSAKSDQYKNGEAWGGAFWRCRTKLGKTMVDKLLFQTWLKVTPMQDENASLKAFSKSVVDFARTAGGSAAADCFLAQFKDRKIPL